MFVDLTIYLLANKKTRRKTQAISDPRCSVPQTLLRERLLEVLELLGARDGGLLDILSEDVVAEEVEELRRPVLELARQGDVEDTIQLLERLLLRLRHHEEYGEEADDVPASVEGECSLWFECVQERRPSD